MATFQYPSIPAFFDPGQDTVEIGQNQSAADFAEWAVRFDVVDGWETASTTKFINFILNTPAATLTSANFQFADGSVIRIGDDTHGVANDAAANMLRGATGADLLAGLGGDDSLVGGAGTDRLFGGSGDDQVSGGASHDSLRGGAGDDRLYGDGGADELSGDAGRDTMLGGSGDDLYYVDSGDQVIEAPNDGWDHIYSMAPVELRAPDNVEEVSAVGRYAVAVGNALDNKLYGWSAYGGGGSDIVVTLGGTAEGGPGNDTLVDIQGGTFRGGTGVDVLRFAGGGVDDLTKLTGIEIVDLQHDYPRGRDLARGIVVGTGTINSDTGVLRILAGEGDTLILKDFGWMIAPDSNAAKPGCIVLEKTEGTLVVEQEVDIRIEVKLLKNVSPAPAGTTPAAPLTTGDINGDGFDDMVVRIGQGSRAAYVVFGTSSGLPADPDLSSLDGTNGFAIDLPANERVFSIAFVGDVNGDGRNDIAVGGWHVDPYKNIDGSAYVVYGKADDFTARLDLVSLDSSQGFVVDQKRAFESGPTGAPAGDFNGDGYADVLVHGDEVTYIALGGVGSEHPVIRVSGFSASATPGGDVDGDGFDDVVVMRAGTPYILYGRPVLAEIEGGGAEEGHKIVGTDDSDTLIGGLGDDTINGGAGDDVEKGAPGADVVTGGKGADRLKGDDGDDVLQGGAGTDRLSGDVGNDTVEGGLGIDTLTGGDGDDRFRFHSLDAADRIVDFLSGTDVMALDPTVFTALSPGALASGAFVSAVSDPVAADADDRILYSQSTGELFYDPDGSGAADAVAFAILATAPYPLSAADFIVA